MRINGYTTVEADEPIRFREATGCTVITTGDTDNNELRIWGTPADRIDFLHRLATAATEAAYRLAVEAERAEVGA